MADLDDIRDGDNFGLNTPADTSSFYLKGMNSASWGIKNRMSRIFNRKSGRTVMLAFDHGFLMGPTSGLERIDLNIAPLAEEADCLMGCRGMLRTSIPAENTKPICLRTDSGTTILTEMNHNVLISEQDAISMNASDYGRHARHRRRPTPKLQQLPTSLSLSTSATNTVSPSWA